ncbi:NAD(P)/FAD-dependent oxidoreductase [Afipia clevelandensis]|uniref:HI0933 family flavoprotein n=1 Tax=Afipia clevelandensis ATCC 49720 TaxID=883079 RepID=K8PNK8_9BRAD|nr:TIGR03862 family flavoprotein [Afipia clevelandensis]EKS42384.1 HI0933 family flavoprotein [Afipia clevelandensis ATCC 49720]
MNIAVIGAGPAGLMAAEVLSAGGARVTVYERMPSVGRKFLMAGRGGLNLTHSEPLDAFLARYREAMPHLRAAVEAFPPDALRAWSEALGQPTFVGSSGRVFPQAMKASPLLRAWLRRLDQFGVQFALRYHWTGWTAAGALRFETPDGEALVQPDAVVIALGGASWPRLGADGDWIASFRAKGIGIAALRAANSGFHVTWSDLFRDRFEGQPLKGIALALGGETVRGEAMVTRDGLEGGAIYALSAPIRDEILTQGEAVVHVALRPDLTGSELTARFSKPRQKQSMSTYLRKAAGLLPVAIGLMQEAAIAAGLNLSEMDSETLAAFINAVPVRLAGVAPLARAISTAGGISFDEVDAHFMLRKMPGVFVAGEMLNWEAPTGGYLLQACFATGAAAAEGALDYLKR